MNGSLLNRHTYIVPRMSVDESLVAFRVTSCRMVQVRSPGGISLQPAPAADAASRRAGSTERRIEVPGSLRIRRIYAGSDRAVKVRGADGVGAPRPTPRNPAGREPRRGR